MTLNKWIRRFLASWCFVASGALLISEIDYFNLEYTNSVDFIIFSAVLISIGGFLFVIDHFFKKIFIDDKVLAFSVVVYVITLISKNNDFYTYIALCTVVAVVFYYLSIKNTLSLDKFKFPNFVAYISIGVIFVLSAFFIGKITVLRYMTFSSPNYDFGIFSQMFYNMKEHLIPVTTCERDGLLSHFAVHISPIYYLLLPFYMIFPSPITLQVGQAVLLASGVFPLYFIAKKYGISNKLSVLMCTVYAFYPVLAAGTFYDIHENCFLTPLLLWVFYFFEKKKYIPMYVFALLVCMVKEDAAIYIAIFALYILLSRKKYIHGGAVLVISVVYFLSVTAILSKYGTGVMTSRYSNYIYGDSGLFGMMKTIFVNPGYVFTQIFKANENLNVREFLFDKLTYIMYMFLPLGFLPVLSKKTSRFILLMPILLINLMSMYVYQYNINFQYNFGTTAFLFYLAVMNLSEMKLPTKRFMLSFCTVSTAMLFCLVVMPKYNYYTDMYSESKETYTQMNEILDTIPDDASVICSTMLLPHLSSREILYEDYYTSNDAEYVVLDYRGGWVGQSTRFYNEYISRGYVVYAEYEDMIMILHNPSYTEE